MKVKNILLTISLLGFAIGFSDLHESMIFWLGRPVGAIFAIAYFICVLLEKPFAEFDAENAPVAKRVAARAEAKSPSSRGLSTVAP